jgi:hypothetical protein
MTATPRVPADVPGRTMGLARATSTEPDRAVGPLAGRWLRVLVPLGLWIVTLNVAGVLRLHRLTRASAMSAHVG